MNLRSFPFQEVISSGFLKNVFRWLYCTWCSVFVEQVIAAQLVKNFSLCSWNPNIHQCIYIRQSTLSCGSSIHLTSSQPISLRSTLILPSKLCLGLPDCQNVVCISCFFHVCYTSHPTHLFDIIIPIILDEECKLWISPHFILKYTQSIFFL